jgi:hypothetical protein
LPDFSHTTNQNVGKYIKLSQHYQMAIKYIFHSKALQILPKLGFLVRKRTIWQPWILFPRARKILAHFCAKGGAKRERFFQNFFFSAADIQPF